MPSTPHAPHPQYTPPNDYLSFKGTHKYNSQYIRAVGGTTGHWAAFTWRFLPNDFRMQTLYGMGRDWPISYDELEAFYLVRVILQGVSRKTDEGHAFMPDSFQQEFYYRPLGETAHGYCYRTALL